MPPRGGAPTERGDEENETESWHDVEGPRGVSAVKGDKTLADLAEQFEVYPTQITDWKQPLLRWFTT